MVNLGLFFVLFCFKKKKTSLNDVFFNSFYKYKFSDMLQC